MELWGKAYKEEEREITMNWVIGYIILGLIVTGVLYLLSKSAPVIEDDEYE